MTKPTILIVDDDVVNRHLLKVFVQQFGCSPVVAVSGKEGVKLYAEHHPELVLMDIVMPIMDGIESTREIRAYELEQDIPAITIIAVTGRDEKSIETECKSAGLNRIIGKPIKANQIKEAVEDVIDIRQGRV